MILRIGTRGSQLALWQAKTVASLLEARGTAVDLVIIKTSGDRLQEAPLSEVGGKRLFVKEIEDALLREEVDLAVHSAKDMPAVLPDGLEIAATLPREDPRDAIVLPAGGSSGTLDSVLSALGPTPSIGTSSVRRAAQLVALMPGARFGPVRGNVDTRLRKLDGGEFDGLILASAGMRRLGFAPRISVAVPEVDCVPAPGQGIVAVEIRTGDTRTATALQPLHDAAAGASLIAERTVVTTLGGGCQLPLGAITLHRGENLEMVALVCSTDGERVVRARGTRRASEPEALGRSVAEELVKQGATAILDEVRRTQGPVEGSY
jgi:hydroxymethylbilane synthase